MGAEVNRKTKHRITFLDRHPMLPVVLAFLLFAILFGVMESFPVFGKPTVWKGRPVSELIEQRGQPTRRIKTEDGEILLYQRMYVTENGNRVNEWKVQVDKNGIIRGVDWVH